MYPYPGDKIATKLIYEKFGQLNVYSSILGFEAQIDIKYPSPFRNDGKTPSFNIYNDKGVLRWNDHGGLDDKLPLSQRDCVGLLMQLENILRIQACSKIWASKISIKKIDHTKDRVHPFLSIRTEWRDYEWEWWNFIDRSLLKKYNVYPTELLEIGNTKIISTKSSPSFTYLYGHTDPSWKVYSPFLTLNKWKSYKMKNVIDGWEQLPRNGEILYIVSSKKDGMVMTSCTGKPFIAPPSEKDFFEILNRSHIINERFKKVVISLDSDKTGIKSTNWLSEVTGWDKILLPKEYFEIKDQTEIIKKLGYLKLKSIYE